MTDFIKSRRAFLALSGAAMVAGCSSVSLGRNRGTSEVMTINGFLAENDTLFLSGEVDAGAAQRFAELLAADPGLTKLVIAEASGDQGSAGALALGRAVRAAGMTTELRNDSVAVGGAVDVFLGGVTRVMQDGAVMRVRGKNLDRHADYKAYLTETTDADFVGFIDSGLSRLRARDLRLHEIQRYGLISGNIVEAFEAQN
jgi:hypothetical protein